MITSTKFFVRKLAAVALMAVCLAQPVWAGNKAQVSTKTGVGKVEASISYTNSDGVLQLIEVKQPPAGITGSETVSFPAAAVFNPLYPPASFPANGLRSNLPKDCPTNVYCSITTQKVGTLWQAIVRSYVSPGAVADNPELEQKVQITPTTCPAVYDVVAELDNGKLKLTGTATDGTAIWLRAFSYNGTNPDPTRDEILGNSVLKGELVSAGPFDYSDCGVAVSVSGDQDKVYLLIDTVARSLPYTMTAPDVTFECSKSGGLLYPVPAIAGGCDPGEATVTYSIAANALPLGDTTVTATARKDGGVIAVCTFKATVKDTTPPVIVATGTPANGVLSFNPGAAAINAALGTATATDACGVGAPTANDSVVTVDGCNRSQTRTWTVTDAGGNAATPVSRTVTWIEDTTKPVITAAGNPANGLLGMNPTSTEIENALGTATATDNFGPVTPTAQTSVVTVNSCSRSQTRTWTVTDAAGNAATPVSRTVTWSEDRIAPVPPVLSAVTLNLCASGVLTAPIAMDNCAGPVTGTTTTVFPIKKCGATVVTWTFNDGNGNISTATQTVTVNTLDFEGFFSPINGTGGTFANPKLSNIKRGSVIPVKFETECEGDHYRSAVPGVPTMSVLRYTSANNSQPVAGGGNFRRVGTRDEDDWHFDWDTSGLSAGVYQIIATLQDGTPRTVFVSIKN